MPLTDQQVAQRIAKARALKAVLIADALCRAGCDSVTARRLDEAGRRNAEAEAMVRRPASDKTWDVVFAVLERRETSSREEADANEREMLGTH